MKKVNLILVAIMFSINITAQTTPIVNGINRVGTDSSSPWGYSSLIATNAGVGRNGTHAGTGFGNLLLGYASGNNLTGGHWNNFIGHHAGANTTSGQSNNFIGYFAGQNNTTGKYNNFINAFAGTHNITGKHNNYIGYGTGYKNTTGIFNSFVGSLAGYNNTGSNNTFIGTYSGYNATGSNNVFLGYFAGRYETGNNKLHIANTSSKTLIYGQFDTNQVGINTTTIPSDYTFAVNGKMITEAVKIQKVTNWADFVFTNTYNLPTLEEVAKQIAEKGHLKDIPSAKEVAKNGIDLGEINAKLLQKIEELTLYVIQQNKRIQALEEKQKSLN